MTKLLKGPIFILDDEQIIVDMLTALFGHHNIPVLGYTDTEVAIDAFIHLQQLPQVAIVDMTLPGDMTGFDVCKRLTEFDREDETLKVIYTGYEIPFTKLLTIDSGVEAVLNKTQYTGIGLMNELEFLLRRRQDRYRVKPVSVAPRRHMSMIGFAVLLSALIGGLSAIGAVDYHLASVERARHNQEIEDMRKAEDARFLDLQHAMEREEDQKLAEMRREQDLQERRQALFDVKLNDLYNDMAIHGLLSKSPRGKKK